MAGLPLRTNIHDAPSSFVVHLVGEHLHNHSLVCAEVLGHVDPELYPEISRAAPPCAKSLHAHTGEGNLVSRVGTGGDLDVDSAV